MNVKMCMSSHATGAFFRSIQLGASFTNCFYGLERNNIFMLSDSISFKDLYKKHDIRVYVVVVY